VPFVTAKLRPHFQPSAVRGLFSSCIFFLPFACWVFGQWILAIGINLNYLFIEPCSCSNLPRVILAFHVAFLIPLTNTAFFSAISKQWKPRSAVTVTTTTITIDIGRKGTRIMVFMLCKVSQPRITLEIIATVYYKLYSRYTTITMSV
jgi:hypothetical protein